VYEYKTICQACLHNYWIVEENEQIGLGYLYFCFGWNGRIHLDIHQIL